MKLFRWFILLIGLIGICIWAILSSTSILASESEIFRASSNWSVTNWSNVGTLTTRTSRQQYTEIASDPNGNIYAIWVDNDNSVYVRHRDSAGKWFLEEKIDDNQGEEILHTKIAADDFGNVYAIWIEDINPNPHSNDSRIMYNKKLAGGSWGNPILVPNSTFLRKDIPPDIAVNNHGDVYIAWTKLGPGNYAIYSLLIQGNTGELAVVNPNHYEVTVQNISIGIDSAGVGYILWSEGSIGLNDRIYFSSRQPGENWQPASMLTSGSNRQHSPKISVENSGKAHAVWAEGNYVLYSSLEVGGTWQLPVQINSVTSEIAIWPDLAIDKFGNIAVIWGYGRYFSSLEIYNNYKPSGGNWSESQQLASEMYVGNDRNYSIALNASGNAYVVWDHGYPNTKTWFMTTQPAFLNSSKNASEIIADPDSVVTYQIAINNTLPFSTDFEVTDVLPNLTEYISGTLSTNHGNISIKENTVIWSGSIASNETIQSFFDVRISSTITGSASISNKANATGADQAPMVLENIILINPKQNFLPLIRQP